MAQAPAPESSEGLFRLNSGTDNCPFEIERIQDCDGFALHPSSNGVAHESVRFCQINKGFKVQQKPGQKILREVVSRDNYVRKQETTIYIDKDNSLSLMQEDTVIQDGPGKFLWEHSRNGRGFSCLYSK
ncbi:hypothetical protein [Bdellovibrio bacteriovorus]|uniref:Uncharacterized protein n=1 Tax=Bdellovibrio bacteriovorus str. Tiberius TaxID=1069642 RepID=K7YT72_BDEBC|nr:hypothetical protein [Bdellovibrio bacteriovorus]AFY00828.1 hypothetical protein Bdt_1128 [Bdellovibrio bacteriovorus str. Tiberius]